MMGCMAATQSGKIIGFMDVAISIAVDVLTDSHSITDTYKNKK